MKSRTKIGFIPYICIIEKSQNMKILVKIAALAALAALVSGCCACRSYQKKTRRPLVGTEWQLIQLGGKTIQPEEGKYTVTLLAEDNRLAGVGACNRLMGTYKEGEKRALKIGPVASTMMACPGMELEREFAKALESTTHYDMDGPMLLLLGDGELKAVFQVKQ